MSILVSGPRFEAVDPRKLPPSPEGCPIEQQQAALDMAARLTAQVAEIRTTAAHLRQQLQHVTTIDHEGRARLSRGMRSKLAAQGVSTMLVDRNINANDQLKFELDDFERRLSRALPTRS